MIGAAEMVLKGCTAAYDLAAEFPVPSVEGLSAMAKAYEEVGMRCVLAPMVADITFFEAIPGLMERLPPAPAEGGRELQARAVEGDHQADEEGAAEVAVRDRCSSRWRRPSRTIAATPS